MSEIDQKFKHFKKIYFLDALLIKAGVRLSIFSANPMGLGVSAIAAAKLYRSKSIFESKISTHACHFLWKLKRKS